MSLAPDHDLIKAAIEALKASTTVSALVGARIYDRVPEKAAGAPGIPSPYISVGPTSILPGDVECVDGVELTIQFDVWSWGEGEAYSSAECRTIVEAIRRTLHDAELELTDNGLVTINHELSQVLRDPDGVTNHGVVQFTAIVETP